jgi:hypothetical protein
MEEKVTEEFKADKNLKFSQKIEKANAMSSFQDLLLPMSIKQLKDIMVLDLAKAKGLL